MPDSTPLFATRLPDGSVVFEFTGVIHAEGLNLNAPTSGPPADQDKVRWIADADGLPVAEYSVIRTPGTPGTRILEFGLNRADGVGGIIDSGVIIQEIPAGTNSFITFVAKAGHVDSGVRTLMEYPPAETVARSSYLQFADTALGESKSRYVQFGSQSGVWPGGVNALATPVYAHGLPLPAGAFYFATFVDQSAGLNAPAIVTTVLPNPTNCQFKIWNPFGNPPAGTPWFIYVMTILFYSP